MLLQGVLDTLLKQDDPRIALALACVSRSMREAVMRNRGFSFGDYTFTRDSSGCLTITVDSPGRPQALGAPPVQWWTPCGGVVMRAQQADDLPALRRMVELAVDHWPGAAITGLCVDSECGAPEEVEGARGEMRRVLARAGSTLEHLSVDFLSGDAVPREGLDGGGSPPRRLRQVHANCFDGPDGVSLGGWLADSPMEVLQLCQCRCLDAATLREVTQANRTHGALRELYLDASSVTPAGVGAVQRPDTLQQLSLVECDAIDSLDLTHFTGLRSLLLSRTPIALHRVAGLAACTRLERVNVGGCKAVDDVNALAALPRLRELFAHETSLTTAGIRQLGRCQTLEKLNLGGCMRLGDVSALGSLTALVELHLWHTQVSNEGIAGLQGCISLEELVLDGCHRITDVAPLAGLPALRFLSLIETSVDAAGVCDLVHCACLETLGISGTAVPRPPKLWNHAAIQAFLRTLATPAVSPPGSRGI